MLQKYRLVFNAVILIAATFFFTPSQASAAPPCPEYMPNKYCNIFKTNCDRGRKPACNQLIRQKRAENKMKYVCKRSRGKHKYCNVLRHQKQRKLAMDRRSRSPRVARSCVVGNSCRIENQRCQNAYKNKKRIRGQFVCKSIRKQVNSRQTGFYKKKTFIIVKRWTRVLPPRRTVAQTGAVRGKTQCSSLWSEKLCESELARCKGGDSGACKSLDDDWKKHEKLVGACNFKTELYYKGDRREREKKIRMDICAELEEVKKLLAAKNMQVNLASGIEILLNKAKKEWEESQGKKPWEKYLIEAIPETKDKWKFCGDDKVYTPDLAFKFPPPNIAIKGYVHPAGKPICGRSSIYSDDLNPVLESACKNDKWKYVGKSSILSYSAYPDKSAGTFGEIKEFPDPGAEIYFDSISKDIISKHDKCAFQKWASAEPEAAKAYKASMFVEEKKRLTKKLCPGDRHNRWDQCTSSPEEQLASFTKANKHSSGSSGSDSKYQGCWTENSHYGKIVTQSCSLSIHTKFVKKVGPLDKKRWELGTRTVSWNGNKLQFEGAGKLNNCHVTKVVSASDVLNSWDESCALKAIPNDLNDVGLAIKEGKAEFTKRMVSKCLYTPDDILIQDGGNLQRRGLVRGEKNGECDIYRFANRSLRRIAFGAAQKHAAVDCKAKGYQIKKPELSKGGRLARLQIELAALVNDETHEDRGHPTILAERAKGPCSRDEWEVFNEYRAGGQHRDKDGKPRCFSLDSGGGFTFDGVAGTGIGADQLEIARNSGIETGLDEAGAQHCASAGFPGNYRRCDWAEPSADRYCMEPKDYEGGPWAKVFSDVVSGEASYSDIPYGGAKCDYVDGSVSCTGSIYVNSQLVYDYDKAETQCQNGKKPDIHSLSKEIRC